MRKKEESDRIMQRLWWLNLIRGIVALIVGMLILVWPTVGTTLIFGGFRIPEMTREQSLGRLLLGLFEVGLGVLLIILDALGPVSKLLAGGWAFIGGIALILQAFQMRRALKVKLVD